MVITFFTTIYASSDLFFDGCKTALSEDKTYIKLDCLTGGYSDLHFSNCTVFVNGTKYFPDKPSAVCNSITEGIKRIVLTTGYERFEWKVKNFPKIEYIKTLINV